MLDFLAGMMSGATLGVFMMAALMLAKEAVEPRALSKEMAEQSGIGTERRRGTCGSRRREVQSTVRWRDDRG